MTKIGTDFPVAILRIDAVELAAFAGVQYFPEPGRGLFTLIERVSTHRPDIIHGISYQSRGLDDLQVYGADGAETFLGIAVQFCGSNDAAGSDEVIINEALLVQASEIRARLAGVLPMIIDAPLCVVVGFDC